MPQFSRYNTLSQLLDIAGSPAQSGTRTLTDETGGLGAALSGQTGSAASIGIVAGGLAPLTGLTGMTANSVGNWLTVSGAASAGNNGTFLIVAFTSATAVTIANAAGISSDINNGAISWTERQAYSLNDDLDFERSDRQAIKGVNYDQPVPVYQRPTAVGTNVPANLSNIAGKTTDAVAYSMTRGAYGIAVAATNTKITYTSAGNLKHSDSVDTTGVPVFDAAPFTGDFTSCYVEITNAADGSELIVPSGPQAGERIFGVTNGGSSTSPNSVEIVFYSCPIATNIVTGSTAYTWQAGLPTSINLNYGYNQRLDQLDQNAFRVQASLGLLTDADLRQDINDIQVVIGEADGATSLAGLLTNTGANYVFFNLPDATPSVVEALNTLNAQVGNRTYTGSILTSGQTIAASLQALSTAISNTTVIRTVERLASVVNANTSHVLPGGLTYTLDGTDNGLHLWVFTRGVLRDPGTVANGDDYAETDTTHITFYAKQNAKDHINYFTH